MIRLGLERHSGQSSVANEHVLKVSIVTTSRKRAAPKTKKAAESGPKLRANGHVEPKLASVDAAKAWDRWTKRGPQGPIEDDAEIPN